jgi:hypothetical protein
MAMWQLMIHGLEGQTYCIDVERPKTMTVLELKEKVKAKTGIDTDQQRLLYGGKQLEDENLLTDYGLQNNSVLFLVLRLPGGSLRSDSKRNPHPSLPRADSECVITLTEGDSLKMPCGHPISPDGLSEHIKNELEVRKKSQVQCPVDGCERKLPIDVLEKYSDATPIEKMFMELKLSENACKKSPITVECPQCESWCEPKNPSQVDVVCLACKANGKSVVFCYKCSHYCTWERHSSKYICKNRDCPSNGERETQKILKEAKMGTVIRVPCPSIRACPNCNTLIQHIEACKHMTCKHCSTKFCFLCLKIKPKDGNWPCGYAYHKCTAAPRQTLY